MFIDEIQKFYQKKETRYLTHGFHPYPNKLALNMITSIINMVLLSFLAGLAGAVISFLIWYNVKTKKFIMRYEYES